MPHIHFTYIFILAGKPSLCYILSADSVGDFPDNSIDVSNCAGQTTQEYVDQWASQAVASHEDACKCPVSALIGEPMHKVIFFYVWVC